MSPSANDGNIRGVSKGTARIATLRHTSATINLMKLPRLPTGWYWIWLTVEDFPMEVSSPTLVACQGAPGPDMHYVRRTPTSISLRGPGSPCGDPSGSRASAPLAVVQAVLGLDPAMVSRP